MERRGVSRNGTGIFQQRVRDRMILGDKQSRLPQCRNTAEDTPWRWLNPIAGQSRPIGESQRRSYPRQSRLAALAMISLSWHLMTVVATILVEPWAQWRIAEFRINFYYCFCFSLLELKNQLNFFSFLGPLLIKNCQPPKVSCLFRCSPKSSDVVGHPLVYQMLGYRPFPEATARTDA